MSDEKSAAFLEIDLLVNDNKDLRKTDKDEYSADIWLTNVARLGELNNWKDEQILDGCLLALKDVDSVWRESELRLGSTSLTTWALFKLSLIHI